MSRRLEASKQSYDPKTAKLRFSFSIGSLVSFFWIMPGAIQTTKMRIYSQNLNGITQDKEDCLQKLMDKLLLDELSCVKPFVPLRRTLALKLNF